LSSDLHGLETKYPDQHFTEEEFQRHTSSIFLLLSILKTTSIKTKHKALKGRDQLETLGPEEKHKELLAFLFA
jgi:hypothetical protein